MTPSVTRRLGLAAAALALVSASATACSRSGADEPVAAGTTVATTPATAGPGTVAPATALPPATEAPTTEAPTTTTEPPTTAAPTTTAPVTTQPAPPPRPPRLPPPKAGRPAPPDAIALPGPEVIANEGLWSPIGSLVDGAPAMYATNVRANGSGSVIAGIVWIDHTAVQGQLFPGLSQPGGQWSVPSNIPLEMKPRLLAAFNSGFLLGEAQGGFYLDGREGIALRNGSAALAIDTNGRMTVGMLGRDVGVGPDTLAIRQNLPLLVDDGVVAASATDKDNYVWGKTLGGGAFVWRSGIGVRGDGTLVYVAGPSMSARTLGNTLVAAGAVRAMELDINPLWVTFNWFTCNGGDCSGTKLLSGMNRDPNRYLLPDDRDFFAIFARA